ncbi:putative membrane protein [Shigella flexneri K-227]|uniref:Putative membrane protein n=1 Tax=Shigella flexneri K-227 TaxID=766147 RepID=F5NWN6_SHIFL|nr:membrane protein [Shigella flexneri G1663]EGK21939.1 putative membrane protein [Shigella flexneri K-218]EGK36523.1 putative membrane protein [Shigella flexneri K-227]EIQ25704.1 putative membrane protein [Shigella flexneri K-404]
MSVVFGSLVILLVLLEEIYLVTTYGMKLIYKFKQQNKLDMV